MSEAIKPNSLKHRVAELEGQVAAITSLVGMLGFVAFGEDFPSVARQAAAELSPELKVSREALLRLGAVADQHLAAVARNAQDA